MAQLSIIRDTRVRRTNTGAARQPWCLAVSISDIYLAGVMVSRGDRSAQLTPYEARLLAALLIKGKGIVSKNELLDYIYQDVDSEPEDVNHVISVIACKLRSKLKDTGICIKNTFGQGWELVL